MRYIVALVFIMICCRPAYSQTNKAEVSAIAFYNLENLFDTVDDTSKKDEEFTPSGDYNYTQKVYRHKLHNLAVVIEQLGRDVIAEGVAFLGVSEVENVNVLIDLTTQPELISRHYQSICFYGPDERGINNGFIYNPKYFKLVAATTLPVNLTTTDKEDRTRDILYVTGVLSGSDTVHILVNHWPSRSGGQVASAPKRAAAAKVNKKVVDSILAARPQHKIFVMGDMNDDPTDVSVSEILNATGKRNNLKDRSLYNPWVAFYKKGNGTLGYRDVWNLFDQIIISANLLTTDKKQSTGWRYYRSEVFVRPFLIEKYGQYKGYPKRAFVNSSWNDGYSDHLPVVMYLVRDIDN